MTKDALPFDVKPGKVDLKTDVIHGYPALAEPAKRFLCDFCAFVADRGWQRVVITEFGRLREQQQALYTRARAEDLRTLLENRGPNTNHPWLRRLDAKIAELNRLVPNIPDKTEAGIALVASQLAWETFSWHCLGIYPGEEPMCRAFDIRTRELLGDKVRVIYNAGQRAEMRVWTQDWAKREGIKVDFVYHVGTAEHIHIELERSRKPADWL